jgi:hypothetical protein
MNTSHSARSSSRHPSWLLFFALVAGFGLAQKAAPTLASAAPAAGGQAAEKLTDKVLQHVGSMRGLCVIVGDTQCELARELARKSEFLVYVQLADAKAVDAARRAADAAGLYGTRIFVERGAPTRLYLADNLADALVTMGDAAVPESEALRVLHPQGKAFLGQRELVKPFPKGADDWSHPYHGPDNNPASKDQVARGPYLTQFLADPRYAPLPQVAVASAGRVLSSLATSP